ncbi:hypothetical protein BDW42DRAFT_166633 [Aspergillus taichungensis]|uniref:Uncharacterized protein n=1 Tax=Aspergillus taichungensis TaxID=482145 RepID=A0A2J5HYN2_9EURO|nr:hypothetical protein BDW42DRAFT_166633 [Aspergillus taichungensis]
MQHHVQLDMVCLTGYAGAHNQSLVECRAYHILLEYAGKTEGGRYTLPSLFLFSFLFFFFFSLCLEQLLSSLSLCLCPE